VFYNVGDQAAGLRTQHRTLLAALRPEAVSLVDAFGWEDYALNSALGRADGDVYRALLDMAQVGGVEVPCLLLLRICAVALLLAALLRCGVASSSRWHDLVIDQRAAVSCVGCADAFSWEHHALNSARGRADGDVYKVQHVLLLCCWVTAVHAELLQYCPSLLLLLLQVSPLNRTQQGPAWESVLKPVMHRKPLPKL
jgi:hypothetical protein